MFTMVSLSMYNIAQDYYWQQYAAYEMEIDFDAETHRFDGEQVISYINNSPDTLNRIFYHLFFNAFQPNSMMDMKSRHILDPDNRIGNRIAELTPDEIGYQKIKSLKMNGADCRFEHVGTILEVQLPKSIFPGDSVKLEMQFEAQVPVQIRRSGRNNKEGISYSMTQWYPKLCEYDEQGWHAHPYVAREFHGVWGDFTVKINIDRKYTVAATGVLQNPEKVGHGYSDKNISDRSFLAKKKLCWEFIAEDVHDFAWAADPDYTHLVRKTRAGTEMHYFFEEASANPESWLQLHDILDEAQQFMNAHYGVYPYPVYSIIQGGDGGMEYAMATLVTGNRSLSSLVGVSIHEWMHSWYQMVLATNEALYAWMDEGFTEYAENEVMNHLRMKALIPGTPTDNPQAKALREYANYSGTIIEEPLSTHSDHFVTNTAYGDAAYTKGNVFLAQLEYIVGKEVFDRAILRYFNTWKFKHPDPNDVIRIFEKESGLELDWYREYMVNTTHYLDYEISNVSDAGEFKTGITLKRNGRFPMPVDLRITLRDGSVLQYTIPLRIMRGSKKDSKFDARVLEDWPWTHPEYTFTIDNSFGEVMSVELDPLMRTADKYLENNTYTKK